MAVLCGLGLHEAAPHRIWNDGFYFGRCRRCECELMRREGLWKRVPRGYQVVWRPRCEDDFDFSPWTQDCAPFDAELALLKGRNWV